jgi:hypothetical protein
MTTISTDQAVTALILWENLTHIAEMYPSSERDKLAFVTASNARYAIIEMAGDVDAIFALLPESEQDHLQGIFHTEVLDQFDYESGTVPRLKHSHQAIADWFEANFGLTTEAVARP